MIKMVLGRIYLSSKHILIALLLLIVGIATFFVANKTIIKSFADTLPVVPATVTVQWGDTTGLVSWTSMANAAQYKITLIRVADNAVMQQFVLPATQIKGDNSNVQQLKADVQGVWPGQQYKVAVQELDTSSNALAQPVLSDPGQSVSLNTSLYNGFLDRMNYAAGPINHNLWFQSDYNDNSTQGTFINNQLHGHLETGNIAIEQSFIGQRARVPVDFTNRTATIRGEIDLHSDQPNWFGVVLTPYATHPQNMTDDDDRLTTPRTLPEVELLDGIHSGFRLVYVAGNGNGPINLPSITGSTDEIPNPTNLINVRDDVVMQISTTHIKVTIDGKVYYDTDFPSPLTFSQAYLMLSGEFYPKVAVDGNVVTPCDQPGGKCNVWHIDNWGFDAPSGQVMPQPKAFYQDGCSPEPAGVMPVNTCGKITFPWPDTVGSIESQTIQVTEDPAEFVHAGLAWSTYNWVAKDVARVRVNGGQWHSLSYYPNENGIYGAQSFMVDISPADIHKGSNLVEWQLTNKYDSLPQIYNTQLEVITNKPYVEPQLPSEPTPLGTWDGQGVSSTPLPTITPVPSPTGSAITNGQWQEVSPAGVSRDFNNPPNNYGFQTIVADSIHPGTVYVGTNYQGIWKSTNKGDSWSRIDKPWGSSCATLDGRIWSLTMDISNANLYAANGFGCAQGVFKSTDGGINWHQELPDSIQHDIYHIDTDPYLANHLLISFHNPTTGSDAGVAESLDGGSTWTMHNPNPGWGAGSYIFFMNNSNTWLLTTQDDGIWKTTNSGASWTQVSTQDMQHGANMLYHASNGAWYTGAVGAILKSSDNGDTWTTAATSANDGFNAVIGDGTNLYTQQANTGSNTSGPQSYITSLESNGTNWVQFNNQTFTDGPMSMAYDATNHIIYSSNWDAGIWRLSLGSSVTPTPTASPTPTAGPTPTPTPTPPSTPTPTPTLAPSTNTLGLTTIGSLQDDGDANNMNGSKFTTSSNGGTTKSMSVYVGTIGSSKKYQMAIYTDNQGMPGKLVSHTITGLLTPNSWNTLPISSTLSANTTYWLMYNASGTWNFNNIFYISQNTNIGAWAAQSFGKWPATFPAPHLGGWEFSIYVTYM